MFSKQMHDVNNLATDRWQELVDTIGSTEAGRRTSTAWDVLSGRPAPVQAWPMIRAIALGVVLGWAASEAYRRRRPEIEQTIEKVGAQLQEAKHTIDDRVARAKATPGSPLEKAKAAVSTNGAG